MADAFRKLEAFKDYDASLITDRVKVDERDCWRWQQKLTRNGCGSILRNGVRVSAHEASYIIHYGHLDDSMRVSQTCGNRDCVNPEHLYLSEIMGHHTHNPAYLHSMVDKSTDTGCWEWTGRLNNNGYGIISVGKGAVLMHRASWEVFCGDIPDHLYVLHKCDNRKCINPNHLFLGSLLDNNRDARQKMRTFTDGRHFNARLTVDEVLEIKNMPSVSSDDLASLYSVSRATINAIRSGRNWSHVQ